MVLSLSHLLLISKVIKLPILPKRIKSGMKNLIMLFLNFGSNIADQILDLYVIANMESKWV